jgi:hypothetical protein
MYPASAWSCFAPGHHGYQRMRSHYRTGLDWAIWVASVRTRREDRFLHRRRILSQTSAGALGYIIDSSSQFCSFVCDWRPFLRPDLRG